MKMRSSFVLAFSVAVSAAALPATVHANEPTAGVKNFRELYFSMATVTGVDPNNRTTLGYYRQILTNLPALGRVSEINPQALSAIANLAIFFCERMIEQDMAIADPTRRVAHIAFDFAGGEEQFTQEAVEDLLQRYGRLFLGRALEAAELAVGMASVQASLRNDRAMTRTIGRDQVRNGLIAGCAPVLGSLDFFRN